MKKLFMLLAFVGMCFGASDLKTIVKVPGTAALNGNYQNAPVEVMLNENVLSIVYSINDGAILNSINFTPDQLKFFIANLNLYISKLDAGIVPDEDKALNLGNSYCTVIVMNGGKIFKSSTGVYFNILSDKMFEFFIPASKFNDKNGEYVATEKIWGLMISKANIQKIIQAFKDIANTQGT